MLSDAHQLESDVKDDPLLDADRKSGCWYLQLSEGQVALQVKVTKSLYLDVDYTGRVIGIECVGPIKVTADMLQTCMKG